MRKDISKSLETHFSALKDPSINRKKLYLLIEILFVVLCGSICGAKSWRDFVLFGQEKIGFFKQYFPFIHGIPSKNTIARLFYERFLTNKLPSVVFLLAVYRLMQNKFLAQYGAHWLVENALHWTLDVFLTKITRVFEDNRTLIRHVVLNMLNTVKKHYKGVALKALRKKAGWGNDTLEFILKQNF